MKPRETSLDLAVAANQHGKERDYWLKQLSGELNRTGFPRDKNLIPVQGQSEREMKTVTSGLNQNLFALIDRLSNRSDTRFFQVLAAGLTALLHKWTGALDIIVGTTVYKQGVDVELINGVLALRNRVHPAVTFKELLLRVRQTHRQAIEYQDYPFEILLKHLGPGVTSLFDTAVLLDSIHDKRYIPPVLSGMLFYIVKSGENARVEISYNPLAYEDATIKRIARHYTCLLEKALVNPDLRLSELDILGEEEKKQVLVDFNDTRVWYPGDKTIHELFAEQAGKHPDRTALVGRAGAGGNTHLTYAGLNKRSRQIARLLREQGAGPGTIVAVMLGRSIDMPAGMMAVLQAGAAYLPLEAGLPHTRTGYMLEDSRAAILLMESPLRDPREAIAFNGKFNGRIIKIPAEKPGDGDTCDFPLSSARAGDLAYVIYTSGSTGRPKGVMIRHREVCNFFTGMTAKIDFSPGRAILALTTILFDILVLETLLPLSRGMKVVIADEQRQYDPLLLQDVIVRENIDILQITPSRLKLLTPGTGSDFPHALDKVDVLLVGGEPFGEALFKDLSAGFRGKIYNMYGPTETTVWSLVKDLTGETAITIGSPIANTRVYVVDNHMNLQPVGVPGELLIGGAGVVRGYLNNPELTTEKFAQDYHEENQKFLRGGPGGAVFSKSAPPGRRRQKLYKTGDLARWLPGGEVQFLGRVDLQVKIRGYRVELGEIETCLAGYPGIKEAVVTAGEESNGGKYLCAYIVPGSDVDIEGLREYISRQLPGYMVPGYFVSLAELPLTANGKIDRKSLPAPRVQSESGYAAPRDDIEIKLARLWQEILGIEKIGINDHFFRLGGHSLNAIILISRIRRELDVQIPLSRVFNAPTIKASGEYIRHAARVKGSYPDIRAVEKRDYYPLSSAQKRIFFLQQFENIGTSYNMPSAFKIVGEPDKRKINRIFQFLVKRHEALRTSFGFIGNLPWQRVHENVVFQIEEIDGRQDRIHLLIRDFIRPFDLAAAPLLRVQLAAFPGNEYLLLFDIHHIIADGTSIGILVDEVTKRYEEGGLPPLEIQNKDFSIWQDHWHRSPGLKKQREYWLNIFPGEIPRLNFPLDFPRPAALTFAGDIYEFGIGSKNTSDFQRLTMESGVTLYMNLLALFNVLLYRYTSREDIIVGSPIAGRPHARLQDNIGMFANMLALRNYPRGEITYLSFLKEVKENSIQAFENRDMQLEELVEKLNLARDASRNPLFDVCLVVQNFRHPEIKIKGVECTPYRHINKTTKFDMILYLGEVGEEIRFHLEYATSLFKRATIETFARCFVRALGRVGENPGLKLSELDILSGQEKQQLLNRFNRVEAEKAYTGGKTLHGLLAEQVQRGPDRVALVLGDESMTYSLLDKKAGQIARYIVEGVHIGMDEPVGILTDKSFNCIAAVVGILKAGCAYLPLEPSLPEERLKYMLDDAAVRLIISQKRYIKTLNRLQWECKTVDTFLCLDSGGVHREKETEESELMDKKLWEYVGETAGDEITAGGWKSSYTGEPIAREAMDEYGDNILKKLRPLLHKNMRVLEIGCASGITMYRIAPLTGFYYGTDLSEVIININKRRIKEEGHENILLHCLPAHEIDQINEKDFHLVILNSVIQHFHGHNYLRNVIEKAVGLLAGQGYIFVGDVMDADQKGALIGEMVDFKRTHQNKHVRTKTDWHAELFIPRAFFEDLCLEIPFLRGVEFSGKIYTIENELTKFRYDALIRVDKSGFAGDDGGDGGNGPGKRSAGKHKHQHDLTRLERYGGGGVNRRVNAGNIAYIIYTSGTTGKAKGVLVRHGNVVSLMAAANRNGWFGFNHNDVWTMFHSYSFDFSVWEMYGALLYGGKLVVIPRQAARNRELFFKILQKEQVTVLNQTPPAFYNLVGEIEKHPGCVLPVRYIIFGGEALDPTRLQAWNEKYPGIKLVNMYGITETTVHVTYKELTRGDLLCGESNIGKPLPGVSTYIVDRDLALLPVGVPGELCIGGSGLARGYLNSPGLNREKFLPGSFNPGERLYRSGDLVRLGHGGELQYISRIDKQIKIRGFRIEPGEIENRLLKHPDIEKVYIKANEDKSGDRFLCAYMVSPGPIDIPALREYLGQGLPGYMIPAYFVQIDRIPLTVNGKVDINALPVPGTQVGEGCTAPRDQLDRDMIEIWSGVLGVDKRMIGIDSDFFQLGGHSLKAAALTANIHKKLDVKVPLGEIFQTPSIRELSDYISKKLHEKTGKKSREKFISINNAEEKEYYPLSSVQKRMFVLQQVSEANIAYNEPSAAILEGNPGMEKIRKTFWKLIRRHQGLRTYITTVEGEPVQRVLDKDKAEFDLEYAAAPPGNIPADHITIENIHALTRGFIRPFDLSRAPLLRVGLIKIHEQKHILIIDMHHIITDGISAGIMVTDFTALYSGRELPRLRLRYRDFSQWENSRKGRETFKNQETYWLRELGKEIPVLNLPLDYPGPGYRGYTGDRYYFRLSVPQSKAIHRLAEQEGVTVYILLFSLFNVFLYKLSGQEDMVVGTPVACRRHADLAGLIGMFVNTLVLRNFPIGDQTFSVFLQNVKTRALTAFENQEYPFEKLVERLTLNRKKDSSRNPLFDVLFQYHNIDKPRLEIPGLTITPVEYSDATAKFDLYLQAFTAGERLNFIIEYRTTLFRKGTMETYAKNFKEVVTSVLQNKEIKLQDIGISHNWLSTKSAILKEDQGDFGF